MSFNLKDMVKAKSLAFTESMNTFVENALRSLFDFIANGSKNEFGTTFKDIGENFVRIYIDKLKIDRGEKISEKKIAQNNMLMQVYRGNVNGDHVDSTITVLISPLKRKDIDAQCIILGSEELEAIDKNGKKKNRTHTIVEIELSYFSITEDIEDGKFDTSKWKNILRHEVVHAVDPKIAKDIPSVMEQYNAPGAFKTDNEDYMLIPSEIDSYTTETVEKAIETFLQEGLTLEEALNEIRSGGELLRYVDEDLRRAYRNRPDLLRRYLSYLYQIVIEKMKE